MKLAPNSKTSSSTAIMKAFPSIMVFVFGMATAVIAEGPFTEFPVAERPEGIANGPGSTLLVSQILSGKVLAIDAVTGDTKEAVGEQTNRQAWGLWHDEDQNVILVAGGGPSFGGGVPEVYVYDAGTGQTLVTCTPMAPEKNEFGSFMNDVTVRDAVAYITDSHYGKIMAMDVAMAKTGTCSVWEVDLPDNFDPTKADDWGSNGVVSYEDGLLVSHETDGSVWYITDVEKKTADASVTPSFQEVIADGGALNADGLALLDDKLYVTQNYANEIGVFKLDSNAANSTLAATNLGKLTSPDFDTPSTSALYDGYIFSANSRFASMEDISVPVNSTVIGVKNTFCCDAEEEDDSGGEIIPASNNTTTEDKKDDTGGVDDSAASNEDALGDDNGANSGAQGFCYSYALPSTLVYALYLYMVLA